MIDVSALESISKSIFLPKIGNVTFQARSESSHCTYPWKECSEGDSRQRPHDGTALTSWTRFVQHTDAKCPLLPREAACHDGSRLVMTGRRLVMTGRRLVMTGRRLVMTGGGLS